jgi:protein-L-isoaspartate(D-aspartate) O-methyltransferase
MMDFKAARKKLIAQLSVDIHDKRVLSAMSSLPRELFVPPENRPWAYDDRPLPIGFEQTISQPYIIARMTEALELTGSEKVLEIGTGSGYQTAILARLAKQVITVERIPELANTAHKLLDSLGYANIEIHVASETLGWENSIPYNVILVTAGAPELPNELLAQLDFDGRMVIPVGSRYIQELYKVTKRNGKNIVEKLGSCRFVSLIGKNAWEK